ncbi:MAG: hypothetical protein SVY10_11050 [Thermodesulfobacteriota bacterium]|nr:hypothetical protein [Thermodesulfobacteriota bacterium]
MRAKTNGDDVLSQFKSLRKALVDASSIIYMHKAGFFSELVMEVKLYSPQEVLDETGYESLQVIPIPCIGHAESNDQKLILCALERRLPVISDDKKILLHMKKEKIPYFNALMMLNYLVFKKRVDAESYGIYFKRLTSFAWYSPQVLEFEKNIYNTIIQQEIV